MESSELKKLSWTVVFGPSPCSPVTAGAGPPARNKGWPGDQRLTATGNTGTLKNTFCFWKAIEEHLLGTFFVRLPWSQQWRWSGLLETTDYNRGTKKIYWQLLGWVLHTGERGRRTYPSSTAVLSPRGTEKIHALVRFYICLDSKYPLRYFVYVGDEVWAREDRGEAANCGEARGICQIVQLLRLGNYLSLILSFRMNVLIYSWGSLEEGGLKPFMRLQIQCIVSHNKGKGTIRNLTEKYRPVFAVQYMRHTDD